MKPNKKVENLNRHQTESFDVGFSFSDSVSNILTEMMDWQLIYITKLEGCEDLAKAQT